jgi:hypothetical protein
VSPVSDVQIAVWPEGKPLSKGETAASGRELRRAREMTILCSPKVTQHHGRVNGALPPSKAVLPASKTPADPSSPALGRLAVFVGTRMYLTRACPPVLKPDIEPRK